MGLPLSGPISMNEVAMELGFDSGTQQRLSRLSFDAEKSSPYSLSAFHGYANPGLSKILNSVNLPSINSWVNYTLDISSYAGYQVKLVVEYIGGSTYTGDFQIGNPISVGKSRWNPNDGTNSFETSRSGESSYSSVSWFDIADGSSGNRWNRRNTTPSSRGTGVTPVSPINWFYYAETSSPGYPNKHFWLRSPVTSVLPTGAGISFSYGAYGATIGEFNIYLDVQQ